MCVKLFIINRL